MPHNIAMALFLAGFLFLYSLLNFYLFVRAKTALDISWLSSIPLAVFMIIMITAPIVVRLSENAGGEILARTMAFIGYTWMGLLFLFVFASLTIDFYRLGLSLTARLSGKDLSFVAISTRSYFLLSVTIVVAVAVYGGFEAWAIRSNRITVTTSKLPANASPLRIVQISDVHLGLIVRQARLGRIMELVRSAKPDILVSTGDLVDGQMNDLNGVAELFEGVTPKYGKFAVTGNHEFYAGLEQAMSFTKRAGFRVLRGENTTVGDVVDIVGVDDPAGPGYGSSDMGEKTLLSSLPGGRFVLFLKHRPVVDGTSVGLFDLQLSGHVHCGQIFPFRLITRLFYPFVAGYYAFPQGSALYVNRGSGTWGPPIRFMAPPEVTVIDVIHRPVRR